MENGKENIIINLWHLKEVSPQLTQLLFLPYGVGIEYKIPELYSMLTL